MILHGHRDTAKTEKVGHRDKGAWQQKYTCTCACDTYIQIKLIETSFLLSRKKRKILII